MAERWKVIDCSVDELQSELNDLPAEYMPVFFQWIPENSLPRCLVVCTKPPQQQAVAVPIMMPAGRRN